MDLAVFCGWIFRDACELYFSVYDGLARHVRPLRPHPTLKNSIKLHRSKRPPFLHNGLCLILPRPEGQGNTPHICQITWAQADWLCQTLLARNYRGDIPMSAVEKFPVLLSEAEEESSAVPPCFSDEGINVRI